MKRLMLFLICSVMAACQSSNPNNPGGSNGDIQCKLNSKFVACSSGGSISGTLTVTGLSWLKGGVKVGVGNVTDGTAAAGQWVQYNPTNHNWTIASHTSPPNEAYLVGIYEATGSTCSGGVKCAWFVAPGSIASTTFDAGNCTEDHWFILSTVTDGDARDSGTAVTSAAPSGAFGAVRQASGSGNCTVTVDVAAQPPGSSVAFSALTTGSNTTATMTVGNGATLQGAAGGLVNLNSLTAATGFKVPSAAGAAPTTASVLGYDSTGNTIVYGNGTYTIPVGAISHSWQPGYTGNSAVGTAVASDATKAWGFDLPVNLATSSITYLVQTADNTTDLIDIGIANSAGTLKVDVGPKAGSTAGYFDTAAVKSQNWTQGTVLLTPGKYYLIMTCHTVGGSCAGILAGFASNGYISFANGVSVGSTTSAQLVNITPPADSWTASGLSPIFNLH